MDGLGTREHRDRSVASQLRAGGVHGRAIIDPLVADCHDNNCSPVIQERKVVKFCDIVPCGIYVDLHRVREKRPPPKLVKITL